MKAEILGSVLPWFSVKEDTEFGCTPWTKNIEKVVVCMMKPWKLIEWNENVTEEGIHEDATGDKIWVNGKWSELWWPYWFCWSSHTHRGCNKELN